MKTITLIQYSDYDGMVIYGLFETPELARKYFEKYYGKLRANGVPYSRDIEIEEYRFVTSEEDFDELRKEGIYL